MRRVLSALPILVAGAGGVAAGCVSDARSENPPADARDVGTTLEELSEGLEGCADSTRAPADHRVPCPHLAYVWSPSMPLSELGVAEIRAAAGAMGIPLSVLAASELLEASADPRAGTERLRVSLVAAGATVHYPTLVVLVYGEPLGRALAGYKRAAAYRELVRARLEVATRSGPGEPAPLGLAHRPPGARDGLPGGKGGSGPARALAAPGVRVLWTHTVSPPPGAFFRRIAGTTYISYDQRGAVHLRDLASGEAFRGPGWIDFVPTPDGRIFVTPARGNGGLEFYLAEAVFREGRSGGAEDVEPFVVDRQMSDQYPSVGILATGEDGRPARYRILVSWFSGLAFRDYDVRWAEGGPPDIEAVTPKLTGCPGKDLSTPILSRDGREIAARDEETGTTRVFRLENDGTCSELLDLGRQTSKVGFSDDGTLIAYSSPDPSSAGSGVRSTTWVLNRAEMRTTAVPHSASVGLVVPEVVGADSLLIAVREEARSREAEFRLLCCVR